MSMSNPERTLQIEGHGSGDSLGAEQATTHRIVAFALVFFSGACAPLFANVNLEFRPASPVARVNDTINVGLYAVYSGSGSSTIVAMDVLLQWDASKLQLLGNVNNGPYSWQQSNFPSDSGLDGLNNTFTDGNAKYTALAQFASTAQATPAGLLVTTFQFKALAVTSGTTVSIPPALGSFSFTAVYGNAFPGEDVTGTRGTANVVVYVPSGEIRLRTGSEPSSASVAAPNSISVGLEVASLTDAVNGVQARISYNPALLSLSTGSTTAAVGWTIVSVTDSGGLANCVLINNGGSVGPGSGPFSIATLHFCAAAGLGSTTIDFQPDDGVFTTKLTTADAVPVSISGANLTKTPSGSISVDPSTVTASSNSPACLGGTLNLQGGPNGMTAYSWTGPNGFTSALQNPSITNVTAAAAGTYTLMVTNTNGCQGTAQTTVSTVAAPTSEAGSNQTICGGGSVTLAGSVTNAASFAWSGGAGTFVPNNTTLNAVYTPSAAEIAAGSVTLTLTATGNGSCGNAVDTMTITIQACVTVNISIPGLIGSASEGGHVADRPVEFVLTACPATTETRSQTLPFVRSGSNGTAQFTLTNVNPSTNWISVRESHTLRKTAAVDLSGDANDTVSVSLKSGDFQTATVSQDDLVDILDFSIFAARWNSVVSDCVSGNPEDCPLGGDATGDGAQNTVDFTAIQINFFKVSDPLDNCPHPLVDKPNGAHPAGSDVQFVDGGIAASRGRSSMSVVELSPLVSRVAGADYTGDGVVDGNDVRAFARANGLVLLPEFEAKLGPVAVERPESDK